MEKRETPLWVHHARKFIATGRSQYLMTAKDACTDEAIRVFLGREELAESILDYAVFEPLAESLQQQNRTKEFVAVSILGIRMVALHASQPERLDRQSRTSTYEVCDWAASLCRDHGFTECEAFFSETLGTRAARLHQWDEACALLRHSLGLYRILAQSEPKIYRPNVAAALNNLGIVLREQRNFPEARKACDEALKISWELARSEPEIYRPHVAMNLINLGNVLLDQRNFPEVRKAYSEALDIYRELAQSEPEIYRPHVATTLNNLGNVLSEQRNFPEARKAYEKALEIRKELAKDEPKIYRPNVAAALNNLGIVLREQRKFPEARKAWDEALDIYRELAQSEPEIYQKDVAKMLNNLGNVLRDQRNFPEARKACGEALDIYQELAQSEPEIYQRDVAMTLNSLGNVLSAQRNFPEARRAYDESFKIRWELAQSEPITYRPDAATTLNNLGNVLSEQRNFPEARKAYDEVLKIRRELAQSEPEIYQPDLAMTLHNLGNVLSEQRKFPEARKACDEALKIRRELAQSEPEIYQPDVTMTLNNLGTVLANLQDTEAAQAASKQAIEAAEDAQIPSGQIWLAKGNASASYRRRLLLLARSTNTEAVFRTLAAMREGPVRSLGSDPDEGLDACAAALADAGSRTGKPLKILVAQDVGGETLLAVLQANATVPIQFDLDKSYHKAANKLFQETVTVFNDEDKRGYEDRRKQIDRLTIDAWNVLPAFVQETLDHRADQTVLVSGDRYWNAFPWEILPCHEDAEFPFLGLHRVLARWSPLTATSIRKLKPTCFGEGKKTAAVFCPWNATEDLEKHLDGAMNEAKYVADMLKDTLRYHLVPDGDCIAGENATVDEFESILTNAQSLIHYTGHGTISDGEELLVLHSGQDGEAHRLFGREEIRNLKQRLGRNKLLEHRPLVVLNSCMTGQTRDFGGQREDLAATFLEEGSEAVIASALPVYDRLGQTFGESLYSEGFVSSKGMGQTLVNVRRVIELAARENKSRTWPTWALLSYHGNPFAQLPHMHNQTWDSTQQQSSFFSVLAGILHLKSPEEAEALIRRIAN